MCYKHVIEVFKKKDTRGYRIYHRVEIIKSIPSYDIPTDRWYLKSAALFVVYRQGIKSNTNDVTAETKNK